MYNKQNSTQRFMKLEVKYDIFLHMEIQVNGVGDDNWVDLLLDHIMTLGVLI